MKTRFLALALLPLALSAQNRTKFAGIYNAVEYAYGTGGSVAQPLRVGIGNAVTGAQTISLVTGVTTLSDGTNITPVTTTTPITVGNGADAETVTPSAVVCPTPLVTNSCQITATFARLHFTGDRVASGTIGLQEALNAAAVKHGSVVVDGSWNAAGGTSGMISAATISTGTAIADNRAGAVFGSGSGNATTINGASVPASQPCLGSNSGSQITAGGCAKSLTLYGADPTGTVSSSTAIATAFAAAAAGHFPLWCDDGATFLVSSTASLPAGVSLYGNAGQCKIFDGANSLQTLMAVSSNNTIQGIAIEQDFSPVGFSSVALQISAGGTNIKIIGNKFDNASNSGVEDILFSGLGISHVKITGNTFNSFTYGILTDQTAYDFVDLLIDSNQFTNIYGDGVELNDGVLQTGRTPFTQSGQNWIISNNTFSGWQISNNNNAGFGVGNASNSAGTIANNTFSGCANECIHNEQVSYLTTITGNIVNGTSAIGSFDRSCIGSLGSAYISIIGNQLNGCGSNGIFFAFETTGQNKYGIISGNNIRNVTLNGIYLGGGTFSNYSDITVTGNAIVGSAGAGIQIQGGPGDVKILANHLNLNNYGIDLSLVTGMQRSIKIAGNDLRGNTTAAFNDPPAGSANVYVDDFIVNTDALSVTAGASTATQNFSLGAYASGIFSVQMDRVGGGAANTTSATYQVDYDGVAPMTFKQLTGPVNGGVIVNPLRQSGSNIQYSVLNGFGTTQTFSLEARFQGTMLRGATTGATNTGVTILDASTATPTWHFENSNRFDNFKFTISQNTTSETLNGLYTGQRVNLIACQAASGGPFTFAPIAGIKNMGTFPSLAGVCGFQSFEYDGATLYAVTGMVYSTGSVVATQVGDVIAGTSFFSQRIGSNALVAITSGSDDVAIGRSAVAGLTTGTKDVGVGFQALFSVTTQTDNTALGAQALQGASSSFNTSVGSNSLLGNLAGANNTALGYQAGYGSAPNANTTGANNTFLGYQAAPGSATQQNFMTVIGAGAAGACNNCIALGRTGANDVVIENSEFTVATLPAAASYTRGCTWVSDGAAIPVYLATAAGGGSLRLHVCSDGTNWQNH